MAIATTAARTAMWTSLRIVLLLVGVGWWSDACRSGGLGRGDVMVSPEQVLRVVLGLHLPQARPGLGVEEGARVDRLLDEVGVVAAAVRSDRPVDRFQVARRRRRRLLVHGDAEREHRELPGQ